MTLPALDEGPQAPPGGLELVVAFDEALGMGRDGDLPWRLPTDMAHFKRLTRATQDPAAVNAVIMGRRTWDSIPARFRPLAGRLNVVLSRGDRAALGLPEEVLLAGSLDEALAQLDATEGLERRFVAGGRSVYAAALAHPRCTAVHLTRVAGTWDCDLEFLADPAYPQALAQYTEHRLECVARSHTTDTSGVALTFERWLTTR